jgi:2-polyprenyl-3-methyl-5-hydroxy-6-metoxy-1,4-benzoquinol methylase
MTCEFTGSEYWDQRYRGEAYFYGFRPNDFLREHAGLFQAGDRVLSLAEGEGRNAVFLAQHGCQVRGVDFSAQGYKKALELAQQQGVSIEYDVADLTRYDMGEAKWDGVVSIFCHLSESDRPALYRSIKRGLKPGGIFLLESYNKKQLEYGTGGPKDAFHLVSLTDLTGAFDGFEIVLARDIVRDVQEGTHHNGAGAVTQFIGRKAG